MYIQRPRIQLTAAIRDSAAGAAAHVPGEIAEITDRTIVLTFAAVDAARWGLGASLDLELTCPTTGKSMIEAVTVAGRAEIDGERSYELAFKALDFWSRMRMELHRGLDKRAAFRVAIPRLQPIGVQVTTDTGIELIGTIADISETGVAFRIPRIGDEALADAEYLHLEFPLPTERKPVRVWGNIRHRSLYADSYGYGVAMDPRTEGYDELRKQIAHYIAECEDGWVTAPEDEFEKALTMSLEADELELSEAREHATEPPAAAAPNPAPVPQRRKGDRPALDKRGRDPRYDEPSTADWCRVKRPRQPCVPARMMRRDGNGSSSRGPS